MKHFRNFPRNCIEEHKVSNFNGDVNIVLKSKFRYLVAKLAVYIIRYYYVELCPSIYDAYRTVNVFDLRYEKK